jgi:NAD-dependent dihydropyrimidine dehydrogenase PreA subunit
LPIGDNKLKRQIININETKCTGCGDCITGCPEGALQIIDGKARLVSDLFCDGLGACIGTCPVGAIDIEEREAEPYDEYIVMANIVKGGVNVIKAHLKHLNDHGEKKFLAEATDYLVKNGFEVPEYKEKLPCGCPGTMTKSIERKPQSATSENVKLQPELNNWPIQLQLLNPNAPYLENADILISADCVPFAFPNFHQRFLKGKVLIMFCPKLDKTLDNYIDKLADIFTNQNIQSITIVHMEVPCCSGVEIIVKKALEKAQKIITLKDYTVSISGEII